MKLLFCDKCWDIFKLTRELRSCECGNVKGMYINNEEAIVNGKGVSLAIGNGSLMQAIHNSQLIEEDRQGYIVRAGMLAWVRPHTGAGNPHTTVDDSLE